MRKESLTTILIVDDDPDLCTILYRNLKSIAKVHLEGNLSGCLEYLTKKTPSLILLDNNLPDGFGITFLKNFRYLFKDMKIIIITADTAEKLREESLSAGAVHFLCKPFTIRTITDTVKYVLGIH